MNIEAAIPGRSGGPHISNAHEIVTDREAAVEVDGNGLIVSANPAAATLLDVPGDALIGRDLFRDVAPAMATPFCLGRFLDGVRAGRLDEDFAFVFGREAGSIQLRVRMSGADAGPYRVRLDATRLFPPTEHREAMLAVDLRSRAESVDPSVCEREPIQIPGSIQPPNGLIGIDPDTFDVTVSSENLAELLGIDGQPVLGRTLDTILPAQFVEALREELRDGRIPHGPPIRHDVSVGTPPRFFAAMLHRHDGRVVIELEATPVNPRDFGAPSAGALKSAVWSLRACVSLAEISQTAARIVREFTGYERVLVYRFDPDWNGEAVAESIVDDWSESLLGLRFPASDIPRQARELYTRSPARFVIDRDAAPVPLTSSGADNRPVDLTFATLRTLSPVHIEYQRNLGVNGSMSVAIMVERRLWGLMIGHHRRPHYVAPETRDTVAVVVDSLSLGIVDIERRALVATQTAHLNEQIALLGQMAGADDVAEALTAGTSRLTDLFGSTGAAVVSGTAVVTVGETPSGSAVLQLAEHLRAGPPGPGSVATDNLAALAPGIELPTDIASGMLAAFIDPARTAMLLWFRPEVVRRVIWGGDPSKPVMADARSSAVLPRRSFERWMEERRGFAAPWSGWEIEIGETLARAVDGVSLRTSRRVAELSAKQDELLAALSQKDQLIAEKDLLTREIDHRVKNSLQIVSAFLRMQSRSVQDEDARAAFNDTYARVMSIARVHDSLYQSGDLSEVDLGQTVETLCLDLAGVTGADKDMELVAERGLMVPYRKAVALCLIATELVTNAWKYAYPGQNSGVVEVVVGRHGDGGLQLRVRDKGVGLPAGWDRQKSKGLGMQLIRAMLSQIDATMDVETTSGACFTVRC